MPDDAPAAAMQAVLHHLSAGDLAAAEAAMAPLSEAQLCSLDLPPFCDPFQAAGFGYGRRRLAELFRRHQAGSVFLRLRCVQWDIEDGVPDTLAELQAIQAMPGAAAFAVQVLACYRRLGQPDLIADMLRTLGLDRLPVADQLRVGFDIATVLREQDLRGALFQQLHRMTPLCAEDLELTIRLADFYVGIGERSFARDAFERLPDALRDAPMSRLYRVQLARDYDRDAILAGLQRLATEPLTDWQFWFRLSYAAEEVGGHALALAATRKALANPPADPVWLAIRLAQVLVSNGQHRAALAEIEALAGNDQAMTFSAQLLADLALACDAPGLAVRLCARWLALGPQDVQARVMDCVYQRKAGDADGLRHAAAALLDRLRAGQGFTLAQFRLLLDAFGGVDAAWVTPVAEAAARQHPGHPEFAALATQAAFAAKFRAADPPPRRGVVGAARALRCGALPRAPPEDGRPLDTFHKGVKGTTVPFRVQGSALQTSTEPPPMRFTLPRRGLFHLAAAGLAAKAEAATPTDTGHVQGGAVDFPSEVAPSERPIAQPPVPLPAGERVGFAVLGLGVSRWRRSCPPFAHPSARSWSRWSAARPTRRSSWPRSTASRGRRLRCTTSRVRPHPRQPGRSRPSTSCCRTRCTASTPSAPPRPASTCCARSRWRRVAAECQAMIAACAGRTAS